MTYEYTETSAYLCYPDTEKLITAITEQFSVEGMVRVEKPAKRLHRAPPLQNNRWAVHLLVGQNGWNLLRATPWNLWCDHAEGVEDNRFVALAKRLSAAGFFINVMDRYPDAYGEVLIEVDGKGQSVATGNWAEQDWPSDGSELDTSWFYGGKLQSGRIDPRSPALKTLWRESNELFNNGANTDYEDCRGDSDKEIFCHYLMRRLLGQSPYDLGDSGCWPAESRKVLYFEWPAGDRPEPPEPPAVEDVLYPDGERVEEDDAVLLDQGLTAGQVTNFLCSGNTVSIVAVDIGEPGKRAVHVDRIAHGMRLVERNSHDYQRAATRFLADHASNGDVPAMYAYGVRHIRGEGVPADPRIAYEWLTLAADKGMAEAQCLVGAMSKDKPKATHYFRMAAEQGIEQAQFEMGLAYQNGLGVTPDGREAMRWYDLAAKQGNHAALYNLGHVWVLDFKQTSDANADAAWFKVQAENGDAPAQWIMGLCAEYGSGGAHKDPTEAVRYYRMGAEQGFGPAICNLADKYENGVGVQQDLAEALRLYLQAADKRVTAAFHSLGNMYKEGRGVPQDTVQATYWLKKAAADGWEAAKAALREIQGPENG